MDGSAVRPIQAFVRGFEALRRAVPIPESRVVRFVVALLPAVVVGCVLATVLPQPFGPLRLFAKGLAPIALVLPLAVALPVGVFRSGAIALVSVSAMVLLGAACLAVYGVPLSLDVVVPLLALAAPKPGPFLAAVFLVGATALLGSLYRWAPPPVRTLPGFAVAAAEAIYFAGFLLLSTRDLGPWSWVGVFSFQLLAASVRGVPAPRAAMGSLAVLAAMLWSGSTVIAFLVHLSLLGSGPVSPGSNAQSFAR